MARACNMRLVALLLVSFFGGLLPASGVTNPLDVSALQALYGSLNGPPQLIGWNSFGGDPCGGKPWRGVYCSGDSIIAVKIGGMGVGGSLGSQLSSFLSLKELDVSNNNIGGEIPYALPPNATHINLAANNLINSIPYSLTSLKLLIYLNASHNSLSGPIGNVFADMQSLEQLDLSFNSFTGDLPTSFGTLTKLHSLYLQDNKFTGSVVYLANLSLSVLYLENNHFSGIVPKQFGSIPQLRIFGNLFEPVTFSPPKINGTAASTPMPAKRNASHSPSFTSDSFSYSSIQVQRRNHRRFGPAALASTVCGMFLVVLLAAGAIIIHVHKSQRGSFIMSKSTDESLPHLPISLPTVLSARSDAWPYESPRITTFRPPSVRHIKPERISKRRSASRRSQNTVTVKLYSDAELQMATNKYDERNLIGEGSTGRVYRAEFADGQVLAVKKIDMVELAVHEEDEFLDVIWTLSRLRHPNITTLLGYCVEQHQHTLVYEYAKNGSLDDVLFSQNGTSNPLSWKSRVRIALGVAHALEYMHFVCSPPIAHENIKSTNILLDNELMSHLSDCGIAVLYPFIRPKTPEMLNRLTGYAAPEQNVPGIDKTKADTYSFGVVLLELLTGMRAFDGSGRTEEQSLVKWASYRLHDFSLLEEMVDPAIKCNIPARVLSRFADIILLCIQPEPEFRSPMTEIVEKLLRLVQKMCHYSKFSPAEPSDLNFSDLSFCTTLAYFDQSSPRNL